jgi:hypothetical protein
MHKTLSFAALVVTSLALAGCGYTPEQRATSAPVSSGHSAAVCPNRRNSSASAPRCWVRGCGILIFSSLAATGATLAGDTSKHLTNPKNLANSKQGANVKGDKVPPNGAADWVVLHHVGPQAPIVMGRSVSLHHKTKLHHVNKPLENSTSADGSQ